MLYSSAAKKGLVPLIGKVAKMPPCSQRDECGPRAATGIRGCPPLFDGGECKR